MTMRFEPHAYAAELARHGDHAVEGGVLYRWVGTHWDACDQASAERHAYRWISENDSSHTSAPNAAKAVHGAKLWLENVPVSCGDVVIPCQNGYVRLERESWLFTSPQKRDGLRHVLRCQYDPSCRAPLFVDFLQTVLPDAEVRARVQEYIGYTLTSDARYQRAQLWLGPGGNGKGVLANIVQELHGNTAAISLDKLDGFRLSGLVGASLIFVDEVPKNRIDEQTLKSLIAGELVQIDRKHEKPISVHVCGKWLVLGNHVPTVTDHSIGFWRRWDVIPFGVSIDSAKCDPLLAQKIIENELSGVLNWALEGLLRLTARGAFESVLPHAIQEFLSEAKRETNSVQAWLEDNDVVSTSEPTSPKGFIYDHYRNWCVRNGIPPMASPRFWKLLGDVVPLNLARNRSGQKQIRYCNLKVPGYVASSLPEFSPALASICLTKAA